MSLRTVLAAAAVLAFAAPAFAGQTPATPPAAPPTAEAAAEAAFEARAEAFGARMDTMGEEMRAAAAASADQDAARTALDAIVARYQPEADAFADELIAFIAGRMADAPEEQRAQMTAMGPMIAAQVKGAPAQSRDGVLAAMAATAAAGTAQ